MDTDTRFKQIRARLGMNQRELAEALGCSQGNIGFYERGQTVLPATAAKLIETARARGLTLSYDMIYGAEPLPPETAEQAAGGQS